MPPPRKMPPPREMPGPLPIKPGIVTSEKESSLINIDASNFLLEILKILSSEIVIKADRIAQDGGRTTIEITDIENAIHELNK
jgi:histone H3/H4